MDALVRELSCRAPYAQRLPNDAHVQFPSPKHVTAANPLSMNHDMHTLIPTLQLARPFSCSHYRGRGGGGWRFHPCYNANSFAGPWTLVRRSRSASRGRSHAKTAAPHALAAPHEAVTTGTVHRLPLKGFSVWVLEPPAFLVTPVRPCRSLLTSGRHWWWISKRSWATGVQQRMHQKGSKCPKCRSQGLDQAPMCFGRHHSRHQ